MKKKRNKKYHPKGIDINAAYNVINLSKPVREDARERLDADIAIALLAFTRGVAEKSHFDVLAQMCDTAMIADQSIFNKVYRDEIMKAREAMIRCRARYKEKGKLGLDGEGLQAIKQCNLIYQEQLKNMTGAEVVSIVKARDMNIRSGNYFRG